MKSVIITFTILNLVSCSKVKQHNENVNNIEGKINPIILNEIKNIKTNTESKYNNTYYFMVSFYEKGDSNFVAMTYDLKPPYILNPNYILGFVECNYGYIIFSNTTSNEISEYFLKDLKLNTDLSKLKEDSEGKGLHIEGKVRRYYIDKRMNLILIK